MVQGLKKPLTSKVTKFKSDKYYKLIDTINWFPSLKQNWDSYNADPIDEIAVKKAKEVLENLQSHLFLDSDMYIHLFPMRDGGIQFEFDKGNLCAELEIGALGNLTFISFDKEFNVLSRFENFDLSKLSTVLEETQHV